MNFSGVDSVPMFDGYRCCGAQKPTRSTVACHFKDRHAAAARGASLSEDTNLPVLEWAGAPYVFCFRFSRFRIAEVSLVL